jgi:hypothetical protein
MKVGGKEAGMRNLLAAVGATVGLVVLMAATSPAGSALIAGLTMTGID